MKKVLLLTMVLVIAISAMAGVESAPTRLDNTRSLGMGRAYTANGLDRVGVFFYNPAAIQNVDFSKPTFLNFTISGSMDWQDIIDKIDDLANNLDPADFDVDTTDPLNAATYAKYNTAFDAVQTTINGVNSLYNVNGSGFFQELGNWTNNGFGFAFFAKAGIDVGINNTTVADAVASGALTVNEVELINAGRATAQDIANNGTAVAAAVITGAALIDANIANNAFFGSGAATINSFPGLDIKNYIDLGVMMTKGFTKNLDKKYAGSDEYARLDYGVSAKMIWRSNLVDLNDQTIDGISAGVADFTANEDVSSRFDSIDKTRFGFDVGALLHTKDKMNTRFGLSIMDIISSDFGNNFDAPDPQINLGVALRPFVKAENTLMRKVDVALDLQDIANSDKDFDQQLKIGVEGRTT
ncbi:MAG: hypothetical protein C0601_00005 [Candidatus Muiribacterium halophilum]|uniref:DUF5723 domain-containing protein n=1 Tax=Muiribacterium halophilum TaxID=2053465 RepID=A0A2N5ZNL2_MUIH1|nr:MAG: hypothetical protein C0601_00005 [Candidatus Muirbacterium halophilum]